MSHIEVTVAWKDRILSGFGFSKPGPIYIGGEDADVMVPGLARHQLLTLGAQTKLQLAPGMTGAVISANGRTPLDTGAFFMRPGETAKLEMPGGLLSLYVRETPRPPQAQASSLIDMHSDEMTGILLALATLFVFWLNMGKPSALPVEQMREESHIASVIFKIPPVHVEPAPEPIAVNPAPAAPSKPKIPKAHEGAKSKGAPGGILSAFGSKGMNEALSRTFSNDLSQAVGEGNHGTANAPGLALKDTGAGKDGQTVSIGGMQTHGRADGATGYHVGGLGHKAASRIEIQGKDFGATGGMDREAIRRVIVEHLPEIRACYEHELQRSPGLYGKLVVTWDIEENGRAVRATVKSNSLESPAVGECLVAHLKSWRFPNPPANQIGRISYPFIFSSN